MKQRLSVIVFLCVLFIFIGTVSADEKLFNPSLFSAGEIVPELPSFWIANYIEIQEFMKKYPDFKCEHYDNEYEGQRYDQLVCPSVNNQWSRDVTIHFFFAGDHAGMTGFQNAVFTISTPQSEDIQEVFEQLWLPDAKPAHRESDEFYSPMNSVIFYTDNTLLRFNLPVYQTQGLDYMTVEIWGLE